MEGLMDQVRNLMLINPEMCGGNCGRMDDPPGGTLRPQKHQVTSSTQPDMRAPTTDAEEPPAPPAHEIDPAFVHLFSLLMEATQQGDLNSMKRMLMDCATGDANKFNRRDGKLWSGDTDEAGWTALMEASEHGTNTKMMHVL